MKTFPRIVGAGCRRPLLHHLKRGGLLAYPTESCYGIGCLPRHTRALSKLVHLKKRPQHKGMIVIGTDLAQLQPLLQPLPAPTAAMLAATWPAAKTFLLPAHPGLSPLLRVKAAVNWLCGCPLMRVPVAYAQCSTAPWFLPPATVRVSARVKANAKSAASLAAMCGLSADASANTKCRARLSTAKAACACADKYS